MDIFKALEDSIQLNDKNPETNEIDKVFIKSHYNRVISLISPLLTKDNTLKLTEYKYNLLIHLFNIANKIEYIPSIFIKEIAKISSFKKIELIGLFEETNKKIEFLSFYYKIITKILNNRFIKEDKKKIFQDTISESLNEQKMIKLMNIFMKAKSQMDEDTTVMLKAIAKADFDFFEFFGEKFKPIITDLINNPQKSKYLVNTYFFRIIEKCIFKLKNIDSEFLHNLTKICYSIIDDFIKNNNTKNAKLYQECMRLMYIIYTKNNENNSKILKFFKLKYTPILSMDRNETFTEEVLNDFIDVNIILLNKHEDINVYYEFIYNFINNNDNNDKSTNEYINCIEKMFKYEIENHYEQIYGVSFICKLLNNFNTKQPEKIINLICKILRCGGQIAIKFLKEISFSNFSFFNNKNNVNLLKDLLDSIQVNVHNKNIFMYYLNYLNLLFTHCLNKNFDIKDFFNFIENIDDQFAEDIFYVIIKYVNDYFIMLQNVKDYLRSIQDQKEEIVNKTLIKFLKILNSYLVKIDIIKEDSYQNILNVYVNFIIVRLFTNSSKNNFDYLLKNSNDDTLKEDKDYDIELYKFAYLLPNLIFNRNTSLSNPIKIELNPLVANNISNQSSVKLLPEGFSNFGEYSSYNLSMRLYYDCIYIQFIAKSYFFVQTFSNNNNSFKPIPGKEEKLSIVSLFEYFTDNIFRINTKNYNIFNNIFQKFFGKYHLNILIEKSNTLFKNKILSYDLKLLFNFCCFYDKKVSENAISIFSKYSEYFPFLLNDYDIFEYCINILGILLSNSVKDFSFYILNIPINNKNNQFCLQLSSDKKDLKEIYKTLYKKIENFLQSSHMINSNNITYNFANYMNKYSNNLKEINEESTFSINILQKLYNNIKKIEIPPTLKTSAYLHPDKFSKYFKEHVLENYEKYNTISSMKDLSAISDYTKSSKLNIRNMYIGIVEGKINAIQNECGALNNYDLCYYKYKWEILKLVKTVFQECNDLDTLSKKICPIIMEITALIVYSQSTDINFKFNKNIISDELINIITSLPLMINTSSVLEKAAFCWEWILFNDIKLIPLILRNLCYYFKHYENKDSSAYKSIDKHKSLIFDLESYIDESILKAKTEYNNICNKINFEKKDYEYIDNNIPNNCKYIKVIDESIQGKIMNENMNEDYINSQIIILQFLKQCMNEFCKIDLEKLSLIFDILSNYVSLIIDDSLFKSTNYIHLHFLTLNISLELLEIMMEKNVIFSNYSDDLFIFQFSLIYYGLIYFDYKKRRHIITSKLQLNELIQTLNNCITLLSTQKKHGPNIKNFNIKNKNSMHKQSSISKALEFIQSIITSKSDDSELTEKDIEHKVYINLLIFLIEDEINNIHYFNNPSSESKFQTKTSEEEIKNLFTKIFQKNDKRCVYLIQRFPWIQQKFPKLVSDFCEYIYRNKKDFYHIPSALTLYVDHIEKNRLKDLESPGIMSKLIYWEFPSLNYALKFISLTYNNMIGLHIYCVQMLNHASPDALIFYLPQLIQSLRTNTNGLVLKLILKKCKKITTVAHQFLWGTEVEEIMDPEITKRYYITNCNTDIKIGEICKLLRLKILKNFNPMQRKFWYEEDSIFGGINDISGLFLNPKFDIKGMSKEEKTKIVREELNKLPSKLLPYIYLPTQPKYQVTKILPQTAVTLQSAKKVPFIVSFEAEEYAGPNKDPLVTKTNIASFIESEIINLQLEKNKDNPNFSSFYNGSLIMKQYEEFKRKEKRNMFTHNTAKSIINSASKNLLQTCITNKEYLEENFEMSDQEEENDSGIFIPKFDLKEINNNENNLDETNSNIKCIINQELVSIETKGKGIDEESSLNAEILKHNKGSKSFFSMKSIKNNMDNSDQNLEPTNSSKKIKKIDNINQLNDCSLDEETIKAINKNRNTNELLLENNTSNNINNRLSSVLNDKNIQKYNKITMSCIFKVGDDLRQDALALQVIKIVQEIFKENNLNLYTYFYQAISTISKNGKKLGGFIEVVENCDSRDQIGKTYETNMYDYYLSIFGQEDSTEFRTARKNLILSLAAYGIISYILQIKDRHNGNILIDIYGHIIHIDFGFIFDISPGGNMKFERAAFKLTTEMINIMKGQNSEAYSKFVDLTIRAFLACRDYVDKLLDPVVLMFSSGLDCFRENSIKNFIERFKLNLNEDEAANFMRKEIDTAADNWRTNAYDWIQNKQNKISY